MPYRSIIRNIFISAGWAFLALSFAQKKNGPYIGQLIKVEGSVYLNDSRAKVAEMLREGDHLRTENGRASLMFTDGESLMHLDQNSEIVVRYEGKPGTGKATVDLKKGRSRALIRNTGNGKKRFELKSRGYVMGVRGTHILADAPEDGTQRPSFLTIEGVAELSRDQEANPIAVLRSLEFADGMANDLKGLGADKIAVEKISSLDAESKAKGIAPPPPFIRSIGDLDRAMDPRQLANPAPEVIQKDPTPGGNLMDESLKFRSTFKINTRITLPK
jgi:hypothetical protein